MSPPVPIPGHRSQPPFTKAWKLLFALSLTVVLLAGLAGAAAESDKLFLWEVAGPKGKVYLLGSIHLARQDLYPLDETIENAFAQSGTLVVEVNLNEMDEGAMQQKALFAGVYGDGRKLEDQLSPGTLNELKSYLDERTIPFTHFNSMKPWLVAMAITSAEMLRQGYLPRFGIDRYFLDQAKASGKPVRALESADFQIELLAGFADDEQDRLLLYTLRQAREAAEVVDAMMTAWKTGDAATIEELIIDVVRTDPKLRPLYYKLFDSRNNDMTRKVAALLDSGGTWFVVIGAGHLVGDTGIVGQLSQSDRQLEIRQLSAATAAGR